MGGIITLVMGSKIGRWAVAGGAALFGIVGLLLQTFRSGAQAQRNKAVTQNLSEVDSAKKIDDAVAGRTVAADRERLQHWSRD